MHWPLLYGTALSMTVKSSSMNSDSSSWRRTQYEAHTSAQNASPRSVVGSELFAMKCHWFSVAGSPVDHQSGRLSLYQCSGVAESRIELRRP